MDSWLDSGQGHSGCHADRDQVSIEVSIKVTFGQRRHVAGRCRATLPYLVVLAVGLFLYYAAENFEFEQASGRIGPGAWPKLILALMLASALWGMVSSAMQAGNPRRQRKPKPMRPRRWSGRRRFIRALVWLAVGATLGYLFIMPVLGFFLATIVYSFVLIYLGHYRQFLQVALLSVAIAFSFMFMFMRVVYVALPVGIAPFDRLSYALMAAMGVH